MRSSGYKLVVKDFGGFREKTPVSRPLHGPRTHARLQGGSMGS